MNNKSFLKEVCDSPQRESFLCFHNLPLQLHRLYQAAILSNTKDRDATAMRFKTLNLTTAK
jgi:hypothetical protein